MRYRRTIAAAVLPITLLQVTGCTHKVWVGPEKIHPEGEYVHGVQTTSGEQVIFDKPKLAKRGNTSIAGRVDDKLLRFPVQDVQWVRVQRSDALATAPIMIVFALAVGAVIAGSCFMNPGCI